MLKDLINEDMKQYMKDKDTFALEAVRMLRSDIKNAEIASKKELDDEEVLKVIRSTVKKNKEAAEIYDKAGRADLRDKENRYTEVLSKYLPRQMDAGEIEKVVKEIVAGMGDVDPRTGFGAVIKAVMAKVGGAADGKTVSSIVKGVLDARN